MVDNNGLVFRKTFATHPATNNELKTCLLDRVFRSVDRMHKLDCLVHDVHSAKGSAMSLLNFGRETGLLLSDEYIRLSDALFVEYNTALRRHS